MPVEELASLFPQFDKLYNVLGENRSDYDMLLDLQAGDPGVLAISRLPNLKSLDLAGCKALTDAGLANLAGLTGLISLNLMWNKLTDRGGPFPLMAHNIDR